MSDALKILFVCSRNKQRSLTAEKIFAGQMGYAVKSAGTENGARVKLTAGLVGWADWIFVMEKKHQQRLREKFADLLPEKKVVCLHIPDDYECMSPALVELLQDRVNEHLPLAD